MITLAWVGGRRRGNLPSVATGLKEQSNIARRNIKRRHADNEANNTHDDRAGDVPELVLGPIGVPRVEERDQAGKHPGRSTHEKSRDGVEAQRAGESRL